MLHDFIKANHDEIVRRARDKAASRTTLRPTDADLARGIPLFLDELAATLRRSSDGMNGEHAAQYGAHLQRSGFTIAQVVHGYGDVCQTVTELALERDASLSVDDFRLFNRCLDDAIADAVTAYENERDHGAALRETRQAAIFSHELRNALNTAMLAFGVLKRGSIGPDSSTAALLNRSLARLRELLDRSIAEVRLEAGLSNVVRTPVSTFIEDSEISSTLEAASRKMTFEVKSEAGLEVECDSLLLTGALANLVQNAFKFTHEGGHVSLSARAEGGRVLIDITDECGGLPVDTAEDLFRFFQQHSSDRSGLGVGLPISRESVRAMNGDIHVRNIAGKGCVFTIDLPQAKPL